MALNKKITSNNGIETNYHRIGMVTSAENLTVVLFSYADESYRLKEKQSYSGGETEEDGSKEFFETTVIAQTVIEIPLNDIEELSFYDIYNKIKTLEEWSDAEDA